MKITKKTPEKVEFIAEIDEELANAIRRSANEIDIYAIDELELYKNDSVLYDEIIAHRVGLIPLQKESIKTKEVTLKLSEKGPKTVYSGDMKGNAKVVFDKIPITKLEEGQEIEFVAKGRLGKGAEHIKFSPGLVYYRHNADIKIKNPNCAECADACPKDVFENKDGKISIKNIQKCDLCGACTEICQESGKECIELNKGDGIQFIVESFGMIEASKILEESINVLNQNLDEVKKSLK